jgi:acyl-CoA thioesterase FadM
VSTSSEEKMERLRVVTRGYEVSSRGRISPSQYLRYIEHVRWRTIASSSKIPVRAFMGIGVVRAQVLEIFHDTSFDTELEISMWLARVGRTSMDFSHDVVRVTDGELVARSTATIVALDAERRPAPIDPEAQRFVVVRDAELIERLEIDELRGAWEHPVAVRPSDEDLQGHVNQARYADFVEDARQLCAAAEGYGPGAWDGPPHRLAISYEDEARVGDPLVVRTRSNADSDAQRLDFVLLKGEGRIATRARIELSRRPGRRP